MPPPLQGTAALRLLLPSRQDSDEVAAYYKALAPEDDDDAYEDDLEFDGDEDASVEVTKP